MSTRGRKRTPTEILRARGSWRANARTHEPELALNIPQAPAWMRVSARRFWPGLAEQISAMRVLTNSDQTALAMLCDALAKYEAAKSIVEREGIIALSGDGSIKEHPASRSQDAAADRIVRLLREFGLTPSARSTVRAEPKKEDDAGDIGRFLRLGSSS